MYWAVVVLATLVIFLAAALIVYLIRDARHRGQADILRLVQNETQDVKALCLDLNHAKQELEAAQMAKAAQQSEELVLTFPSKIRNNSIREEKKVINSFTNPNYRPELNPFENGASALPSPSTKKRQQQQQQPEVGVVVADVHAQPNRHKQQQQPPEGVDAAEVHAEQMTQKQQQQQPEVVVVDEVVPQQQQPEPETMPKFSSAFNGIRSKLERLLEPQLQQQPQPEPVVAQQQKHSEAVVQAKHQPAEAVVDEQQQHQREAVAKPEKEIIYASLVFKPPQGPKRELAAPAPSQTATIKRLSVRRRKAPPPPTFSKPELPFAGVARGGTLPRPQKPPPAPPTNWNQAASSAALDQAPGKAPPFLPQRKSSLRSLNSLRRSQPIPLKLDSKRDLPTQFLNDYDLWDEDERFVTYV